MSLELSQGFLETKTHGSQFFPFNIYPCSIPIDFHAVSLHWQESMELIFIKKGTGVVQVGLDVVEARKGDIFIVPPGTLHALRSIPNQTMEYENFLFDMRFLGSRNVDVCAKEYLIPISAGRLVLPTLLRDDDENYSTFENCLIETEKLCESKRIGYELGVKSNMIRFIYLLLATSSISKQSENTNDRLKSILQSIENNYMHSFNVQDAAKICGYSISHFMRWFKQITGSSFTSYLNERRLVAAAKALKENDETILSIANKVSFDNLSNFNRQFKKRYGISPKTYRNSNNP